MAGAGDKKIEMVEPELEIGAPVQKT